MNTTATSEGTIKFITAALPISLTTKGKQLYRAIIQADKTKTIEQTAADMVRLGCNVNAPTIAYVLNHMVTDIPYLIGADGCRRSLGGLVTLVPRVSGSFTAPDSVFDPEKNAVVIDAITPKGIRASLDGITVLNVTEGTKSSITSTADVATNAPDTVRWTLPFTITGTNIYVCADHADEGVWLVSEGGASTPCTITDEVQNSITCAADSRLAAGTYTLTVATRGGKAPEMGLTTLTREVAIAAETVDAKITYVYDQATNAADTLIGKGALEITGENLAITAANADEGVWLMNADGSEAAKLTISTSIAAKIVVTAAEGVAPGAYTLKVVTRGGKAAVVTPATLTHAITVQ